MTNKPEIAVAIKNIHKEFILPQSKNSTFKQTVVNIVKNNNKVTQKVLNGVSFDIKKGEFFGIVGRNGSGKSTLLKTIAGVYSPTEGEIKLNGTLAPFIELGVGFNPELSGRDNVYLNGALLGFNRRQMDEMYDDIVEFAELEPFMGQKLKNYSSGMQVRLAFSVAIRAKSDILLIDEVLAVGDANFQKKCINVFSDLKSQGRTIIFVTHSMDYVREFCDQVAVIDSGKLLFKGESEKAIDIYNKLNFDKAKLETESENRKKKGHIERFGNGSAEITSYKIFNSNGLETSSLSAGKKFSIELDVSFKNNVDNPAIGVMFRKMPNENLFGINTLYKKVKIGKKKSGDTVKINASGIMPLAAGSYFVSFSISDAKSASEYSELDILNNIMKVDIDGSQCWGLIDSEVNIEVL